VTVHQHPTATGRPRSHPTLYAVTQALAAKTYPGLADQFADDAVFQGDARTVLGVVATQIEEVWAEHVDDVDATAACKIADWLREVAQS
jgi:hypothetical protein